MANPIKKVLHCLPVIPALLLFVSIIFGSCSDRTSGGKAPAESKCQTTESSVRGAKLEGGFESLEALAQAVIDAIAANDEAAFQATRVTEQQYKEIVYASLPANEQSWKTPEKGWGRIDQDSDKAIGRYLSEFGGQSFRLLQVRHIGATHDLGPVKVLAQVVIAVENSAFEAQEWSLMNRVLKMNGKYKAITFDD